MYRCPNLRVIDRKSTILGVAENHNNVKDSECNRIIIEVDKNKIDYPVEIPPEAK